MDELLKDFLSESAEELKAIGVQIARFEEEPSDARVVGNLFRLVHSIKSACGFFNLPRLATLTHAAERLFGWLGDGDAPGKAAVALALAAVERIGFVISGLAETRSEPIGDDRQLVEAIESLIFGASEEGAGARAALWSAPPERRIDTVRVPARALEQMASLVSELVLTRNQICEASRAADVEPLQAPLGRLSSVAADLQASVQAARMQPVERLFAGLQQRLRDLCERSGKRCALKLRGGEIELDRRLVEALREPLGRLVDNAVGHGVEAPDERRRAGKSEEGVITVSVRRSVGGIGIDVSDDGRGLDVGSIRSRAAALGLASPETLAALPEADVFRFVFAPGFSTADKSQAGGRRGVGLDVVRAGLEAIGGSITLASRSGRGATFTLKAPMSPTVAPALIVAAGAERFAAPQHLVEEIAECGPAGGATVEETFAGLMLRSADSIIPAARLADLMGSPAAFRTPQSPPLALRFQSGSRSFAIVVDAIVDVQEIVFKPLPRGLWPLTTVSGCAILGDGEIALVLDPAGLCAAIGLPNGAAPRVVSAQEAAPAGERSKFVVFRTRAGLKALAVSAIARVRPIEPADGFAGEGRLDLRESVWPTSVAGPDGGRSAEPAVAIVVREAGESVTLAVDEIVDIVEGAPAIDHGGQRPPDLGRVRFAGETVETLDSFALIRSMRAARLQALETGSRARVLVVDSPIALHAGLQGAVTAAGYEPVFAADARQALSIALDSDFAAFLADSALLSSTGGAFARALREVRGGRPANLIGLCEHPGRGARRVALEAGFTGAVGWLDRPALVSALETLERGAVQGAGA